MDLFARSWSRKVSLYPETREMKEKRVMAKCVPYPPRRPRHHVDGVVVVVVGRCSVDREPLRKPSHLSAG